MMSFVASFTRLFAKINCSILPQDPELVFIACIVMASTEQAAGLGVLWLPHGPDKPPKSQVGGQ
jgi:hypothetical protein